MRDPVRAALRADAKAWPLGLLLILIYLTLTGSSVHGDEMVTEAVEETDLYSRPISVSDHGLHQVSQ